MKKLLCFLTRNTIQMINNNNAFLHVHVKIYLAAAKHRKGDLKNILLRLAPRVYSIAPFRLLVFIAAARVKPNHEFRHIIELHSLHNTAIPALVVPTRHFNNGPIRGRHFATKGYYQAGLLYNAGSAAAATTIKYNEAAAKEILDTHSAAEPITSTLAAIRGRYYVLAPVTSLWSSCMPALSGLLWPFANLAILLINHKATRAGCCRVQIPFSAPFRYGKVLMVAKAGIAARYSGWL